MSNKCDMCEGKGEAECPLEYGRDDHPESCPSCSGTQKVSPCPRCEGSGKAY